jgi:hypothetical protein
MAEGNKDFIRKYKSLTPKEIEQKFKEKESAKKEMTTNAAELEQEIDNFNKIVDPLENPVTGKVMCWIRRPTQDEWENMIPAEIAQYRNKPEEMPPELSQKYNNMTFELMSQIIETPKHDSKWWKSHSNLVFIQLFNLHLQKVFEELGLSTTNF